MIFKLSGPYGLAEDDFEVLFGTPGDNALVTGGYEWIRGQLVKCQVSGIPTPCADFAAFGYLRRLWEEKAFGEWVGNENEPGGHYVYDLALANKLLGLMAASADENVNRQTIRSVEH